MYKEKEPYVTPKYPIEVPTHLYYSTPCVFKLTLGTKFYIGKCQSLPQFMEGIATVIERALRTGKNDETGWYYHVISYIKKNRVMRAKVERLHEEVKAATWELLKMEQEQLDKNRNNVNCLNNNFDVYIPKWIEPAQAELFKKWKHDTNKGNGNKNRTGNACKKHKGGQLAVRSERRVSGGVRQESGAKKGTGWKGTSTRKKSK